MTGLTFMPCVSFTGLMWLVALVSDLHFFVSLDGAVQENVLSVDKKAVDECSQLTRTCWHSAFGSTIRRTILLEKQFGWRMAIEQHTLHDGSCCPSKTARESKAEFARCFSFPRFSVSIGGRRRVVGRQRDIIASYS
jgi:hypothetical protein